MLNKEYGKEIIFKDYIQLLFENIEVERIYIMK